MGRNSKRKIPKKKKKTHHKGDTPQKKKKQGNTLSESSQQSKNQVGKRSPKAKLERKGKGLKGHLQDTLSRSGEDKKLHDYGLTGGNLLGGKDLGKEREGGGEHFGACNVALKRFFAEFRP